MSQAPQHFHYLDSRAIARACTRALTLALLAPIVAYRRLLSPLLPPRCKYYPTCSRYAYDAIVAYGPFRGLVLAAWRLVRCNPWSLGGVDPVDGQRIFRRRRSHDCGCAPHSAPTN